MTYQVSGLKNGDSAGQVLAGGLGRVGGEAVGQYDILQGGLPSPAATTSSTTRATC
ncbi:MBG domain-containing protein [Pseudomonas aeruginosa]|nr:MBG domain-containing protein [Pseudomonas aeruginosa]